MQSFQAASAPQAPMSRSIDLTEARRRAVVLIKVQDVVLIKFNSKNRPQLNLPLFIRDEQAIAQKRRDEAEKRNLDLVAYRTAGDTGFPVLNNQKDVSIGSLPAQLVSAGLEYIGGHQHQRDDGKWVTTLSFKRPVMFQGNDTAQGIPKILEQYLSQNWTVAIWANLRYKDKEVMEGRQYRLDTINLSGRKDRTNEVRTLSMEGNSYKIS